MDKIYVIFSMVLGIWSICSICLKKQIFAKKFFKSIFSALYFLTACGLAIEPSNSALASFFMLVLGATVVWFCNRKYEEKENVNKDVISDYKNAERNFGLGESYEVKYKSSSNNYAKDKDSALKEIAFAYLNSKGENSFRDVDVKGFDGHYIKGYCHSSSKFKTFRIDRIEGEIIIRETGESLEPYEWGALIEK